MKKKGTNTLLYIAYLGLGVLFGITMTKSEAISWFRIQEMFRFHSFHMYGIIGTAVILGALGVFLLKKKEVRPVGGGDLKLTPKNMSVARYLIGGTIFGLGWAMTGACPGPMYTLLGNGMGVFAVVLLSAAAGTFAYGALRKYLPH